MTGRVKKLFGLLLCMVLLVCLMPVSAMADSPVIRDAGYGFMVQFTGTDAINTNAVASRGDSAGKYQIVLTAGGTDEAITLTGVTCTEACKVTGLAGGLNYTITREAGHDYVRRQLFDQSSTCYSYGYEAYECFICGNKDKKDYFTSLAEHEYTSFTVDGYGIVGTCKNAANCYATATVSLIEKNDLVYTGADLCGSIDAFISGAGFTPDWSKSGDSVNVTDKGFTVSIYMDSVITSRTYEIKPAQLTCSAGLGTAKGVYGEKMSELEIQGLDVTFNGSPVAGKWVFVNSADADTVLKVSDSKTKEYDVKFVPDAGAQNYQPLTAKVKLEIAPKEVTVTGLKAIDREYDGTTDVALDITGAELEGVLDGDEVTLTGGTASVANADAGEAKAVTVTGLALDGEDKANYKLVIPTDLKVNISQMEIEVTGIAVGEAKVYDGTTNHTYTGTPQFEALPYGGWSITGTPVISFEDANVGMGKKLVITGLSVEDDRGNDIGDNFEFIASVTASITPAKVTVTPESNQKKTYGDADPYIGFTATGLVAPDTLTGKLSRPIGENVGTYRITIGTLANPNYEISLTEAYFTINPLQLTSSNTTVTVENYVYDGASHDGFVSAKLGDKELVEGTDFTVQGAEAYTLGSHKLTIEGKGNYSGTVTATWKISLPAIAEKVTDGTITAGNVLTDLTADKIDALVELDAALNSIADNPDATEEQKQMVQDVANKFKPIIDALEGKASTIVDPIKKWLEENLPKADADELEMRKEYEELQAWLKGDGKAWAEVVDANLGKELEEMKNKLYTYLIIVGNGSHWVTTGSEDLGFRANGHLSLFTYVKVDGKAVPRDSYTLYSGSTIVKLHNEYLKTLDKGWHDIQFVYSDGVTNVGKFQVTDRWVDVQTGDGSDMGLWLSFMVMAGLGMTACLPRLVRRKNED